MNEKNCSFAFNSDSLCYITFADQFVDTSISKFNGQITERELQPWEADGEEEGIELESTSSPTLGSSPLESHPSSTSSSSSNKVCTVNNDIVRSYREVIVVTNTATKRTNKA